VTPATTRWSAPMTEVRDLIVWWCPRCERQSERMYHFCEKGPPLFPQLDVETRCEEIKVVPAEQKANADD
jgi:hypothetical protein